MRTKTGPPLLGLTGAARCGKDTLAEMLAVESSFRRVSFAAPLRKFVADLAGLSLKDMELQKETPQDLLGGQTPRYTMQTLGTEWGRDMISKSLWCGVAAEEVGALHSKGHPVVVTDLRFDDEAKMIRQLGGRVLRIERPPEALAFASGRDHPSENGVSLRLVDAVIENLDTREALLDSARRAMIWWWPDIKAAAA